ncbi:MAG TPA: GNAT family N-acetyltransferase [Anaerolineales bacterium]|nr:GNAT family N-acetyltransferase [Anaerolineales bacterium]
MPFTLRPATDSDRPFLRQFMLEHWGGDMMLAHGETFYPAEHPAFIAESDGQAAGVITYWFRNGECEVTSLESLRREQGIGTALMNAVIAEAKKASCRRVWLITTNDNLNALRFYQKRGLRLAALYPGAVNESRKLKPQISLIGENGIPLRDELELELPL